MGLFFGGQKIAESSGEEALCIEKYFNGSKMKEIMQVNL
jgi:hypothetical protein